MVKYNGHYNESKISIFLINNVKICIISHNLLFGSSFDHVFKPDDHEEHQDEENNHQKDDCHFHRIPIERLGKHDHELDDLLGGLGKSDHALDDGDQIGNEIFSSEHIV